MRLWGPEQFDPNVVDRRALEAAVNALSEIWKPRRRFMTNVGKLTYSGPEKARRTATSVGAPLASFTASAGDYLCC